jgi:hypothetical protein
MGRWKIWVFYVSPATADGRTKAQNSPTTCLSPPPRTQAEQKKLCVPTSSLRRPSARSARAPPSAPQAPLSSTPAPDLHECRHRPTRPQLPTPDACPPRARPAPPSMTNTGAGRWQRQRTGTAARSLLSSSLLPPSRSFPWPPLSLSLPCLPLSLPATSPLSLSLSTRAQNRSGTRRSVVAAADTGVRKFFLCVVMFITDDLLLVFVTRC